VISTGREPVDGGRRSILFLNWRDTGHPEGGGSELYVEKIAAALARQGNDVTVACAYYRGAATREVRPDGVRVVRVGGRLSVYPRVALAYWRGRLGRPDTIVEVQNGVPFLARLWARRSRRARVVVLVHHVHREQWRVVLPAPLAAIGWWLESRVAPRVNRGCRYVTVSDASRRELAGLGIPFDDIEVIHNGTPTPQARRFPRSTQPTLVAVARLVPHKRIEVAIDATAALLHEFPDLTLTVVGRGWWEEELRRHAVHRGVGHRVRFAGHVDDETKARMYQDAWVSLVPSLKEGWGLVVVEAASYATPSVAFTHAGGVADSIRDGVTGLLAGDRADFVAQVGRLLRHRELRQRLGETAVGYALGFTWTDAAERFTHVIDGTAHGERTGRRRAGRGLLAHAVLDQRAGHLVARRLGSAVDPAAGGGGESGGDQRQQCDPHGNALLAGSGPDR
jgi:glycosyltransferase involved in cell wall biosynthesis